MTKQSHQPSAIFDRLRQLLRFLATPDKYLFLFLWIFFLEGLASYLINDYLTRYRGEAYLPPVWLTFTPIMIALTLFAIWARSVSPKLAYAIRSYGFYFLILVGFAWVVTGVQYTPFSPIDHYLVKFDGFFQFNTVALVNWTNANKAIKKIFEYAYYSLDFELFLTPLVLLLCYRAPANPPRHCESKAQSDPLEIYLLSSCISFFIATLIYYFFPTISPSSQFPSAEYMSSVHLTALKYIEIHHYLPLTVHDSSLIAFPSMHVVWALMVIYCWRPLKYAWYFILLLNSIMILATMFLGWHYLADVMGGFLVAYFSIMLSKLMLTSNLGQK